LAKLCHQPAAEFLDVAVGLGYSSGPQMGSSEQKKGWRLMRRRQVLMPTWRGWLLLLVLLLVLGCTCVRGLYRFLAITDRVPDGVLVVEGWVPDIALTNAITEFHGGRYKMLFVTGSPVELGGPLASYKTYADIGAATLVASGMSTNSVQPVPAPAVPQDRTYTCAVALRQWFKAHGGAPSRLTLMTEGPHARRSRLMFQFALGKDVKVGVIAGEPRDYDPAKWWRYSAGVRTVLSEAIAYTYARFIFRPRAERD
jgi:hypothetical protein